MKTLDVAIVGAGISGIAFLKQALQGKLKAEIFEKSSQVGGLWATLPAWQDIQMNPADWTINDLPLDGVHQPHIQRNIERWVETYSLGPFLNLSCEVTNLREQNGGWRFTANGEEHEAKFVVLATGLHNDPVLPTINRHDSKILEYHSTELRHPSELAGKRVTIVGAGASALDFLDHSLEQGATKIDWVYRSPRWFTPSTKPKHHYAHIRQLAYSQMTSTPESTSLRLREKLDEKYRFFGIEAIKPQRPFDYLYDVPIAGRPLMLKEFSKINRHVGAPISITGNTIHTSAGDFETDIVLWATGFKMNLKRFGLAKLDGIETRDQAAEKCHFFCFSVDYPNLLLFPPALLDTSSSTPFMVTTLAKTLVEHLRGRIRLPKTVIKERVNHWELIKLLAKYDRVNYPPILWKLRERFRVGWYRNHPTRPIRVR